MAKNIVTLLAIGAGAVIVYLLIKKEKQQPTVIETVIIKQ